MQITTSYAMTEVAPERAKEAQQERRAERMMTGQSALSGMSANTGMSDSDADVLTASQLNKRDHKEDSSWTQGPPSRRSSGRGLPPRPPTQEDMQRVEQAPAVGACSAFYQQQQLEGRMDLPPRQEYQRESADEQVPGQSVDVEKMKTQVLKLYGKLTDQGAQLEEKRKDLRQMHRLYVELKRDYESAQEEIDRRDSQISELSEMLATERESILRELHQEHEQLQRRSRGIDTGAATAQRRNCDCTIL